MRISVIIPAYNEDKLIERTIKSLQSQEFPKDKYEILVVDNGSSDKTAEIAKKNNVRVVEFTKSHIVAAIRNFGASKAKGDIVAFMDADSIPEKQWLSSINEQLGKDNIVAAGGVALPENGTLVLNILFGLYNTLLQINQLFGIVLPWGFNLAIKKYAFDQIGGFDEKLTSYEDAEIGLRIQKTFGKKNIVYSQRMKVFTSTRKQQHISTLITYIIDTMKNYINIVIFKKPVVTTIRYIR